MKTFRTLFSGGELFGIGARAAGWIHLDGYEIEAPIVAVACQNGFDVRVADVCDIDYAVLPAVDHLHVSPSCKRASQANTDADEAPEDIACADAVARAIAAHRGDTFTLENVWGYRTFESFGRIEAALKGAGFSYAYWHLNSADYGVPQTRKRLILIARRGECRITRPHPTHRKGGDMFHAPWIGWYAAIEDLIPTLPDTQPAPWQMARLPRDLRETLLIGGANTSEGQTAPGVGVSLVSEPSRCVNASNSTSWRAWLVESKNANQEYGDGLRAMEEPATTVVTDHKPSHQPIALLVGGQYIDPLGAPVRRAAHVAQDEPTWTITPRSNRDTRAYVGRWVRMTVQALGRFQTVPDSYIGLTPQINGNGVPPLLSQRMMESLL